MPGLPVHVRELVAFFPAERQGSLDTSAIAFNCKDDPHSHSCIDSQSVLAKSLQQMGVR